MAKGAGVGSRSIGRLRPSGGASVTASSPVGTLALSREGGLWLLEWPGHSQRFVTRQAALIVAYRMMDAGSFRFVEAA